jgi:hypothetical protein
MPEKIVELEQNIPFEVDQPSNGLLSSIIFAYPHTGTVPGWWTAQRDAWLREEWIKHDALKIAVSTFVDKINTIPSRIVAKDSRNPQSQSDAQMMENIIMSQSGLFRGFKMEIKKAVIDYLTQDNGCFLYVMGSGERALTGGASGLYHLDAGRCERMSDPVFPVKYYDWDGKVYNLHYTRVIYFARNPSPISEYNGVGHSPVSVCLDARQELADMSIMSAEFMGSRPRRRIVYVKKGATIQQMIDALQKAESKMDNAGLTHFAYTTVLAPANRQDELDIDSIDLTNTPDGFDRMEVTIIDKSDIAAAFGLSPSDINVTYGVAGQSGAEGDTPGEVGIGDGPNSFIEDLTGEINKKVLPKHLEIKFDFQDDRQDELQSKIWVNRSLARERDMSAGATSPRTERQRMLRLGEINEEEFEYQELQDGRLPDGTSVLSLYYDPDYANLLNLGVDVPTITSEHDASEMILRLDANRVVVWQFLQGTRLRSNIQRGRASLAAIEVLRDEYQQVLDSEMVEGEDVSTTLETKMA